MGELSEFYPIENNEFHPLLEVPVANADDIQTAYQEFGPTSKTNIAQIHSTRMTIVCAVALLAHGAILALLACGILYYNNYKLGLYAFGFLGSLFPLVLHIAKGGMDPAEVGVKVGSAWITKSLLGAYYIRTIFIYNFIFLFLVCGILHTALFIIPVSEYLAIQYPGTNGCSIRICGMNTHCSVYHPTQDGYAMNPTTLPPIDTDASIQDARYTGLCECREPDGAGWYTPVPNCVSERYWSRTEWTAHNPPVANADALFTSLTEAQQGPTAGFLCDLVCPKTGTPDIDNPGMYTGDLLYWSKPLAYVYILFPLGIFVLFMLEVLAIVLWALSPFAEETLLLEQKLLPKQPVLPYNPAPQWNAAPVSFPPQPQPSTRQVPQYYGQRPQPAAPAAPPRTQASTPRQVFDTMKTIGMDVIKKR